MHRTPASVGFLTAVLALLAFAVGAAVVLVLVLLSPDLAKGLRGLSSNAWWFVYRDAGNAPFAAWRIGFSAAASLLSAAAVMRAGSIHHRSPSPVVAFLAVFLASLGLECLRALSAVLYATEGSITASVLLTRVIYWGRFVGLLALLVAGLYRLGLKYPRFLVPGGVVVLVAFAMAAYIPVDRTQFMAQLTWRLGDEQSVWFLDLAIGALAILTTVVAAATQRGGPGVRLALGVMLLVVCQEFQFFALKPLPIAAGLAAQAVGAVLSLRAFTVKARAAG